LKIKSIDVQASITKIKENIAVASGVFFASCDSTSIAGL